MGETHMKNTMENAKALAGAVHDIAHAVAYPMVTEVVTTVVQNAGRISTLENEMTLRTEFEPTVEGIRQEMHEAVSNMTTPYDEKMAELERDTATEIEDMNKRVLQLEEQMTQLISILSSVANLE